MSLAPPTSSRPAPCAHGGRGACAAHGGGRLTTEHARSHAFRAAASWPNGLEPRLAIILSLSQQLLIRKRALQQNRFQTMSDGIIGKIDEMGTRIDDLEKSIGDIMQQAGIEDEEDGADEERKE
eukprot:COSAG05_NODE_2723_length_2726_cov_3.067377_4_plen_124_part_00